MEQDKRSLFSTIGRTFFGVLFGVLGLFVGLVVIVILLGMLFASGKQEYNMNGRYTMLPDEHGIKHELQSNSPLLLYVDIAGIIGTEELNGNSIREQLERSHQRALGDRIRGVLLAVNSPGGTVFAADDIYRLVKEYHHRFKVPVYVFVDGLCASGGMYIASAAHKILATNSSLIGSVGVMMNFVNVSDTLEKIGVKTLTLTRGKDKDDMNPLRPWREGEQKEFEKIGDFYYDTFVNVVVSGRPNISKQRLVEEYGAKVFPAPEAMSLGYIDGIVESRSEVISMLAKEAGVSDNYQVIQLESRSWLDKLINGRSPLFSGEVRHRVELPGSMPTGLLYLYQPGVQLLKS